MSDPEVDAASLETMRRTTTAAALAATALAGCGGASLAATGTTIHSAALSPASATCQSQVLGQLRQIAAGVYAQAASGRNVVSAQRRLARSTALARAAAADDPRAVRKALIPLIKHQIVRIEIRGIDGDVLARTGDVPALAPVTGTIKDAGHAVATYVLSVAGEGSLTGVMSSLTGATVRPGLKTLSPTTAVIAARRFPSEPLPITLRFPADELTGCGATRAQTHALVVARVGRRLLTAEAAGTAARRDLRHVLADRRFVDAVATDDPAKMRREVIRFFRTRWMHCVRVRATGATGTLVDDIGGPYALQPASATLRLNGRRAGRVTLAVQDDTGYIKLMHRFTGALVELTGPTGAVPGSSPIPPGDYLSETLPATAFPDAPLSVRLLTAAS